MIVTVRIVLVDRCGPTLMDFGIFVAGEDLQGSIQVRLFSRPFNVWSVPLWNVSICVVIIISLGQGTLRSRAKKIRESLFRWQNDV